MSVSDITFKEAGEVIYPPLTVNLSGSTITIQNLGSDDIADAGIYLVSSGTLGDVERLGTRSPETDYYDLLRWGEDDTGLSVEVDAVQYYFTNSQGADLGTKIPLPTIPAGDSIEVELDWTDPAELDARRMYVNFQVG